MQPIMLNMEKPNTKSTRHTLFLKEFDTNAFGDHRDVPVGKNETYFRRINLLLVR